MIQTPTECVGTLLQIVSCGQLSINVTQLLETVRTKRCFSCVCIDAAHASSKAYSFELEGRLY